MAHEGIDLAAVEKAASPYINKVVELSGMNTEQANVARKTALAALINIRINARQFSHGEIGVPASSQEERLILNSVARMILETLASNPDVFVPADWGSEQPKAVDVVPEPMMSAGEEPKTAFERFMSVSEEPQSKEDNVADEATSVQPPATPEPADLVMSSDGAVVGEAAPAVAA